jgi:hypothetical protein
LLVAESSQVAASRKSLRPESLSRIRVTNKGGGDDDDDDDDDDAIDTASNSMPWMKSSEILEVPVDLAVVRA